MSSISSPALIKCNLMAASCFFDPSKRKIKVPVEAENSPSFSVGSVSVSGKYFWLQPNHQGAAGLGNSGSPLSMANRRSLNR